MKRANLLLFLTGATWAAHAASPETTLHIRFCDEVGLSASAFDRLRMEASATLRTASIESAWVYCSVPSPGENPVGCREALKPSEVVVRLLPNATKDHSHALGVSTALKSNSGVHASLHFAQIVGLAERARVEPARLLALIALHEVGHLLLGPDHYPMGIMQSHWSNKQLEETINRSSFFTGPQSKKLRANLSARSAQSLAQSR